jgi:hypothetical protein
MSASISGNLDPQFNPFEETSLAEIVQMTAMAWTRMKQPGTHDLEDSITFRLAGRIANDPQFAEFPYDVVAQYWELGLNGELLGRIDLRFKHRHSKRLYFAFEAKRLHVTYPKGRFSTEYATYTGPDGMGAFVDETYSKGFAAGGMLGYVMDGQSKAALDGLRLKIDERKTELKLSPNSRFALSSLSYVLRGVVDESFLNETSHDLSGHALRLLHLVVPVSQK